MRKLLKVVSLALFALVALVVVGSLSARKSLMYAQASGQQKAVAKHSSAAKPRISGNDGSQTGIASFQGNFTTISAPSSQVIGLARETNCSLTLLTGNYSLGTSLTYTRTGLTTNYDGILHTEAGLTTTPGTYSGGCAAPTTGIGSRPGFFVGTTTSGINVFAAISYSPVTMGGALYIMSGTDTTTYGITTFSFSTAGTLTSADLNGDGNGDIVVLNSNLTTSASVSVLLGNPDGTFKTAVSYPTAGAGAGAAVIDDVNGDGKLDLVVVSAYGYSPGTPQQISVLLGNGDGTFQSAQTVTVPVLSGYTSTTNPPIFNIITADTRNIGKKDVIASNGLVLLGSGDGTFTAASTPAFPYVVDNSSSLGPNLASGDLNKDGKLDLVVGTGANVLTYFGKGDGTFTQGTSYASIDSIGFVTVSDLDGDGNPDIYVGMANGGAYEGDAFENDLSYALMGNGDGTFQGAPYINNSGAYNAYTGTNLGDVNGDGLPDLITQGTTINNALTSTFTVQLATKTGNFNSASTITIPASFSLGGQTLSGSSLSIDTFAVGDLNGDGKADLAFITDGAGSLTYGGFIYWTALSNGDGTFATPVPNLLPQIAPAGDNDGNGNSTITNLQIADVNRDGHVDLLFTFLDPASAGGKSLYFEGFSILPGNGDGTFGNAITTYSYNSASPIPNLTSPPEIVSIADLNNDGKLDLLTVNLNGTYNSAGDLDSTLQVYLGNGDGTFAAPTTVNTAASINVPQAPSSASPCALADFNKDGKLDLACPGATASSQPELAISLGNGDGTFATPAILNLSAGVGDVQGGLEGGIAAADFNGDGNIDLVLIANDSYSGILYGNGDGTFTSVNTGYGIVPQDLINLNVFGAPVVADFNGDGKPDVLAGSTILINAYGRKSTTPTLFSTSTGLTASSSSIAVGGSVTFTATITPAAGSTGTPTGTVTFLDGTTTLGTGTVTSGAAAYTTTALTTGSHSITAVYGGDTNFSGSTSSAVTITVTATSGVIATSATLTASATSATGGTSITFTAVVSPASGTTAPTGTVTFLDGSTTLGTGTLSSGSATISTTTLAVGSHSITAQYGGSSSFASSTSSAVTVTISAPAPDFSLSISPGSGAETKSAAASATLTVTPANGFNAAISFSCSGLPASISCSFSPGTLTPAGKPLSTTVTFSGTASAMAQPNPRDRQIPLVFMALGFGGWLLSRARRNRHLLRRLAIIIFASVLIGIAGCGSSNPTQTSTVTITAAAGAISHTATYSLTTSN